jgi:acid phosphatase (class A)
MKRLLTLLVALAASLLALQAQNIKTYLSAEELPDAVKFLPPPPEEGSAAFALDEAQYRWGKTQREGARGIQAYEESTVNVDTMALMFSKAFGRELSEARTPKTLHLLRRSVKTFRLSATKPKATYMRLRPFVFYREGTLIPRDEEYERTQGSYPSGHTVRGWGMALVLAQLCPERQNEILTAGYEWGQSRVIAGYHWQSDVDASRLLASACFARLQSCPEFLMDLEAARKELKSSLL